MKTSFYVKKVTDFITTLFLVTLVTFFTFQFLPGNPAIAILGPDADPVQIENLEKQFGLEYSLPHRYAMWLKNALHGDFGISYKYNKSVSQLIKESFGITFTLSITTLIFTIIIGTFCGILFAKYRRNKLIKPLVFFNQLWISVPSFCTALILIIFFSVKLRLLPSMGIKDFSSYLLPSFSLALGSGAILTRYVKDSIEKELKQEYVKTARSKGLSENQIIISHVLRNALIPSITTLGLIAAEIFGGSIIIENVFSLPGIGRLLTSSITARDFPLIQGLTIYLALITLICNFTVDILYSIIDPRIRINSNHSRWRKSENEKILSK